MSNNFNIIKNMRPEELARIIMCPNEIDEAGIINCNRSDDSDCYSCCLSWLREKYAEGMDWALVSPAEDVEEAKKSVKKSFTTFFCKQ